MRAGEFLILTINPGSTSTKIGVYANENPELVRNLSHSDEEMRQFSRPAYPRPARFPPGRD